MAHFEFFCGGAVMVFQGKINAEIRAYIFCKKGGNLSQIQQQTGVSRAQIYRIWKAGVDGLRKKKTTIGNRGRPGKLSKRHKDYIIRELPKLRKTNPNWTIKALQEATNSFHVSQQCISNFLHKSGYGFLQSRKKGLLSPKDLKQRVEFAKKMIKCNDSSTFWRETIAFYFDGVSFAYKKNPKAQAVAPTGRVWRKRSEGMDIGCCSRGSKCGSGGSLVKILAAISYGEGFVCKALYEKLDGAFFASFIEREFPTIFKASKKTTTTFLQDGDPSQNSAAAMNSLYKCGYNLRSIPPRSPDINPIENIFHLVRKKLNSDAINHDITSESKDEFIKRVMKTMDEIPIKTINKTIDSLQKRMHDIVKCQGKRTKY